MFLNDTCLEDKFQNAVHKVKIYLNKNLSNVSIVESTIGDSYR